MHQLFAFLAFVSLLCLAGMFVCVIGIGYSTAKKSGWTLLSILKGLAFPAFFIYLFGGWITIIFTVDDKTNVLLAAAALFTPPFVWIFFENKIRDWSSSCIAFSKNKHGD